MRTIKFRGKRVDNGEWVFGSLDLTDNQAVILWDRTNSEGDATPSYTFVDPETVGQFTGLLDENEKEIYEGDIVNESEIRYEICWYADIAAFMAEDVESYRPFPMSYMDLSETTVVGNIHDNPQKINQEIALPFTPSTPCLAEGLRMIADRMMEAHDNGDWQDIAHLALDVIPRLFV